MGCFSKPTELIFMRGQGEILSGTYLFLDQPTKPGGKVLYEHENSQCTSWSCDGGGWISEEGHAIPQRKRRVMAFGVSFSKKLRWHVDLGQALEKSGSWEWGWTKSIFAQVFREERLCSFVLSFLLLPVLRW